MTGQGQAGQGSGLSSAARVREKRRGGLEPPGEPPERAGNGAACSLQQMVSTIYLQVGHVGKSRHLRGESEGDRGGQGVTMHRQDLCPCCITDDPSVVGVTGAGVAWNAESVVFNARTVILVGQSSNGVKLTLICDLCPHLDG